MKPQTFSVLFFIRKTRLLKTGEAPINMRITVDGRFVEMQTLRRILPANWNQRKERAVGKNPAYSEINMYLDSLKGKIYDIQKELSNASLPVNPVLIKDRLLNKQDDCKMFFQLFEEHNNQLEKLLGIDYERSTLGRYKTCLSYFREMYRKEYSKTTDFPVKSLSPDMIQRFEVFLRAEKHLANNTMIRFMKCVKKIVNQALANGWIASNPFATIHYHNEEVTPTFITQEELESLYHKEITIPRLEVIRDVYIFCCFTGLAFVDVKSLKPEHIFKDTNGALWIRKARTKTNVMCNIPLLEIPLSLIKKYSDHPICIAKNVLFPVASNQKTNGYLKELADICGIKKRLTTHTARHTFATTLTLGNGVALENVSKMLGHTNTKMTQHYARVQDASIARDMDNVRQRLIQAI